MTKLGLYIFHFQFCSEMFVHFLMIALLSVIQLGSLQTPEIVLCPYELNTVRHTEIKTKIKCFQ